MIQDAFADRFVPTADGLTIYLRDYAPLEPSSGLPMLCLHGLTRNSRDFEIIAPRLAALGRRVLVMDVRGRGRSDRDPEPMRYGVPTYVGDVMAALDYLQIDRAVFLGTSMGGLITMVFAAMTPGRVAAAILNDVGPELNPVAVARIGAYVGKTNPVESWDEALGITRANNEAAFPGRDDAFWDAFARRCWHEDNGKIALSYDPLIAIPFSQPQGPAPADLKPLFQAAFGAIPTLLIRGALSDLISPEHVATMQALKPDLAFREIAGVGHAPMLEEPEAMAAIIEFLAQAP
ncbi:MAG: alpha/beta hydrolase [Alphaproteobacteria bacterium]|jgi:pimeloyl-ACP methyl ester carboxylesterase|nr:alpha/beta hydrolase [Alphaproteobacteria bacterium]